MVQGLRSRGINVLTTLEANRCTSDDEEQLAFAASQGRAIDTFNVNDFARLHADFAKRDIEHAGVIVIPDQRCSVGEKIRRGA